MFKKEIEGQVSNPQPRSAQGSAGARASSPPGGGGPAVFGPSITIKGDVTGDEDLLIQGRVEGSVDLAQHNVTIGPSGKVKAGVSGRMVVVEGEVEGDLRAVEQIILRRTAKVEGSLSAPRVALEDGASFRGGIEMDSAKKAGPEDAIQPPASKSQEKQGPVAKTTTESAGSTGGKGLSA